MEAILSVEKLISDLLSSSEDKQSEGESMFDILKEQDPNTLALVLAELVGSSNSHDSDFRKKSADLLSNLLTDDEGRIWNNLLSVSTQCTIKSILLIRINLEESKSVIDKLCHTVAKLCNIIFVPSNNWPELVHMLQECIISNSNRLKESFFLIFAKLSKDVCQTLVPDIMILYSLFLKTMNDDTLDLEMRIAALSGVINYILWLSSLNELKRCQNLLPAMMRTLTDSLSKGDQDVAAQYVLKLFIEVAKNEPRFFRTQLVDVVNTMLEIGEALNLEEKTTHLALEFLLTLVEAREKAPGMMRKLPLFTSYYFALLLNLLLDIKDKPSWYISEEKCLDQAGETENHKFGLKSLNRFSNAFGGMAVAPVAVEQLSPYLASPEWEKRHAALSALVYIAKGCSKVLIKYLKRVVSMVLRSFQDPHPRVRSAALRSIAELSRVFSPDLQEQHHNQVMHALTAALDDFQNTRVQAIAIVAVMNCFGGSKNPETLVPYLDAIVNKLVVLVQNDNRMVQEEAIDALGYVAKSSKEHFRKYYGFIVPHLKTIMINANDKSNHMLCSKTLNCISTVWMAVGREKFKHDVNQVMGVLKLSQESLVKEFGSIVDILRTWENICQCMGTDVLPYMSTVMPLLVRCVQLEPENIIDELDHSIHKVNFGNEIIYAKRSHFLEVKSLACYLLGLYANILEEAFYPWISQEAETKICVHILRGLSIYLPSGPLLTEAMLRTIMDAIKHVITESSRRKGDFREKEKAEDFDAEEAEFLREEIEQEEQVSKVVGDILLSLVIEIKADNFTPFYDELSSYLMPLRGKDKTTEEKITCIHTFEGLMVKCSEAATQYRDIYPFLLEWSNDENPRVRERALFGVGLCAQMDFSFFKPFVGEALSRINEVITYLHAREPENELAFDNAISALGRIFLFCWESIDSAEQIVPAWLNCLPIRGDVIQAKFVHQLLCFMVERSDNELLGPTYERFPKVMSAFTEVLCAGKDLATEKTINHMIIMLRNFEETIPPATWASARSLLLPQQEMELDSILSPEEEANFSSVR